MNTSEAAQSSELAAIDWPTFQERYAWAERERLVVALSMTTDDWRREAAKATRAIQEFRQIIRWHRFDTVYGPLITAAVILGTLALAGVWAWLAS